MARAIAGAPPWVVLGAAWMWLFVYAHPGQMTRDSYDHLIEARGGVYTDGHPPLINVIFKWCDFVMPGPVLMLVLQSTVFLAGLYLVLRDLLGERTAAWAAAALFVFPPVMVPMAVIWKDCLMAGFLMLGLAGLLSQRRGARLAGLAGMFAATAVRYNALGATLPLVVLLWEWRPGMHWSRRYALAAAAWLAITVAAFAINGALTDRKMYVWHSSLAVYDAVGALAFVDEDLPDAELQRLFAGTELLTPRDIHATARRLYDPRDFLPIINHATDAMWALPIAGTEPAPAPVRDAVARAWWETITTYPIEYIQHRVTVMGHVLAWSSDPAGAVTRRGGFEATAHQLGLPTGWSATQHWLTKRFAWLARHTPLFLPWLYLLLALALLPFAKRRELVALLASGIVMEATLLVLAASTDYRYSHWMVVCTVVAAVAIAVQRYRASRSLTSAIGGASARAASSKPNVLPTT